MTTDYVYVYVYTCAQTTCASTFQFFLLQILLLCVCVVGELTILVHRHSWRSCKSFPPFFVKGNDFWSYIIHNYNKISQIQQGCQIFTVTCWIHNLGVRLDPTLYNSKSPPFVVYDIWNFTGLVQYATICLKMSPKNCCMRLFFQD